MVGSDGDYTQCTLSSSPGICLPLRPPLLPLTIKFTGIEVEIITAPGCISFSGRGELHGDGQPSFSHLVSVHRGLGHAGRRRMKATLVPQYPNILVPLIEQVIVDCPTCQRGRHKEIHRARQRAAAAGLPYDAVNRGPGPVAMRMMKINRQRKLLEEELHSLEVFDATRRQYNRINASTPTAPQSGTAEYGHQ